MHLGHITLLVRGLAHSSWGDEALGVEQGGHVDHVISHVQDKYLVSKLDIVYVKTEQLYNGVVDSIIDDDEVHL